MFFKKMKEMEPTLFRSEREGHYDSYARLCPSGVNRQPVILTDAEKQKIDNETPGAYNVALQYSTNPDKKYWYVCPRYWCLKTNAPLTHEQVMKGECGGKVIPQNAKQPPPGHYIYEFTDNREHTDKDGNYREHYPGFLSSKSHPSHCLPCCFKKMDSEQQLERRSECGITPTQLSGDPELIQNIIKTQSDWEKKKKKTKKIPGNVFKFETIHIEPHRWGFLPMVVELFLHTDNSRSVSKQNPAVIKKK